MKVPKTKKTQEYHEPCQQTLFQMVPKNLNLSDFK